VEVHHCKRYLNYDPFILATNAIQVYYMPYPQKIKEKVDWWVVIKTRARSMVDDQYTLEVAYEDGLSNTKYVSNDELLSQLRDDEGGYEVVENDVQNHSEHNEDNVEDDTQLTETEYEEESDFYDEYISNDDDININDDHKFYEQYDDDDDNDDFG